MESFRPMNIRNMLRYVRCLRLALILGLPSVVHAGMIDIDRPIAVAPDRGIALFSFTLSTEFQSGTTLQWRQVGTVGDDAEKGEVTLYTGRLLGNEELMASPYRRAGRLVGLDLPPGTYEFYQFRASQNRNLVSAKQDFSRKFVVEAGKINYVGNFDLLTGEGDFGGGRLLLALVTGIFTNALTAYPTLLDRADIDLPLFLAKKNGLAADAIARRVMMDEADSAMLALAQTLRAKAESGDSEAQFLWMVALARGWTILPDERRVKVFDGRDAWPALARQLAAKGVPGAATYLGMRHDLALAKMTSLAGIYATDDPGIALQNYLVDAARYQEGALAGAVRLLKNDRSNDPDAAHLSSVLKKRLDSLRTLSPESLPYGGETARAALRQYINTSPPKYFAVSISGAYGASSGDAPSMKLALDACNATSPTPPMSCRPYAAYSGRRWNACPPELASAKSLEAPPETGLGDVADASRLPAVLDESGRQAYPKFLDLAFPRAFAVSDQGAFGMAAGDCQAAFRALEACARTNRGNCSLWAVDDQIVRGTADAAFSKAEQRLLGLLNDQAKQNLTLSANEGSR
ncbi:MAG TPA: hypothetical protein VF801_00115 [Rhodocyclaceae bacterium]